MQYFSTSRCAFAIQWHAILGRDKKGLRGFCAVAGFLICYGWNFLWCYFHFSVQTLQQCQCCHIKYVMLILLFTLNWVAFVESMYNLSRGGCWIYIYIYISLQKRIGYFNHWVVTLVAVGDSGYEKFGMRGYNCKQPEPKSYLTTDNLHNICEWVTLHFKIWCVCGDSLADVQWSLYLQDKDYYCTLSDTCRCDLF